MNHKDGLFTSVYKLEPTTTMMMTMPACLLFTPFLDATWVPASSPDGFRTWVGHKQKRVASESVCLNDFTIAAVKDRTVGSSSRNSSWEYRAKGWRVRGEEAGWEDEIKFCESERGILCRPLIPTLTLLTDHSIQRVGDWIVQQSTHSVDVCQGRTERKVSSVSTSVSGDH